MENYDPGAASRELTGWMNEIRENAGWGTQTATPAAGPLCRYWEGEDDAVICGHGSCCQIVFEQDRDEEDE